MRVAVVGVTGFAGSHIAVELLQRGHDVTGISRSPEKLGKHDRYKPLSHDIAAATIAETTKVLEGHDVLVNAYNGPQDYSIAARITLLQTAADVVHRGICGDDKKDHPRLQGRTDQLLCDDRRHGKPLTSRRAICDRRR